MRASLTEYYWVDSLENTEAVYRAVGYFIHKFGRIDWLESNNEYWLERDAWLRTQFHITSGFQEGDIDRIKYKSKMKAYYAKAGIPACRWHMVDDFDSCMKFIKEVGWPVVVKPDNGVGASDTHKLESEAELRAFLDSRRTWVHDIMVECVHAEVNSYDDIIDYKSGQEHLRSHSRQVGAYMRQLRDLGYKGVRGFVWYLDTGVIHPVSSPD